MTWLCNHCNEKFEFPNLRILANMQATEVKAGTFCPTRPIKFIIEYKECMYILTLSTKAINCRNCSLFFGASEKCDTYSSDSLFSVVFDITSFPRFFTSNTMTTSKLRIVMIYELLIASKSL